MRRQGQRAIEHAGRLQVIDEGAGPQHQIAALVTGEAAADTAFGHRHRQGTAAFGGIDQLHGVDDLDIAGTAA